MHWTDACVIRRFAGEKMCGCVQQEAFFKVPGKVWGHYTFGMPRAWRSVQAWHASKIFGVHWHEGAGNGVDARHFLYIYQCLSKPLNIAIVSIFATDNGRLKK